MNSYTFNQHRHNYAIWTAARAVQRNFTTTSNIKYAIEQSGLQKFVESEDTVTAEQFGSLHRTWAQLIKTAFREKNGINCTYGRAAKIISIYLKTSIILCNQGTCSRSQVIHPPIDGILLKNLSKIEGLEDFKTIRWTQLSEESYWSLVSRLKEYFKKFDWSLEYYWTPELD